MYNLMVLYKNKQTQHFKFVKEWSKTNKTNSFYSQRKVVMKTVVF
jgi:hypothetical protein